jgi:hypothetical protein
MQSPKKPAVEGPPARQEMEALTKALAEPFDPAEVKFKPAVVTGNRAMALAYVDARVIQDRLDAVLGIDGWQDDYECLPDGSVVCRLRLRMGDEWVTKVDVGGPSEQPDGGDRMKAAFSDALKRAAVKFGLGRYLYRLPAQWVDYDPQRRKFLQIPTLPEKAATAQARRLQGKTNKQAIAHTLPANGDELQRRLTDYDAKLATQGLCAPGDLLQHVIEAGARAGHGKDLAAWSGRAIALAAEETKAFEAKARQRSADQKDVA